MVRQIFNQNRFTFNNISNFTRRNDKQQFPRQQVSNNSLTTNREIIQIIEKGVMILLKEKLDKI